MAGCFWKGGKTASGNRIQNEREEFRSMKKTSIFLLVSMLLCSVLLAGCGGSDSSGSKKAEGPAAGNDNKLIIYTSMKDSLIRGIVDGKAGEHDSPRGSRSHGHRHDQGSQSMLNRFFLHVYAPLFTGSRRICWR